MEGGRKRTTKKNITWTPAMTEFILKYLAKVVRAGYNNHNGFKASILSDAAEAVNKKFEKKMLFCHVQNHLKTVKKRWRRIEFLRSLDGATFHPDTNTIEMHYDVYHKHVEVHPGDEQFINKPIKNYEQMRLVCGNDSTTEVDLVYQRNEDEDDEEVPFTLNSTPSGSKKRKKASQDEMELEETERGQKLHYARWSPVMSKFLLTYLVQEVEAGHKGTAGFKAIAMRNAAEAISEKFSKPVTSCHIQNHLKTVKKYWSSIQRIKNTGAVFNSDTNTLQMGHEEYQKYIEVHPGDDQFINRPIKYYTEMEIIFGSDHLVGLGASKATCDPCEGSSPTPDALLDGDGIGVDADNVPLSANVDGCSDNNNDVDIDDDDDGEDDDNDHPDSECNDDEDGNGDYETTSSRSRKGKKSRQTEENMTNHVERKASTETSKRHHNMRWNSELTEFLLNYLAEQARRGNKESMGFKASVLNGAVRAINEKFCKKMMFSNVQNHLKTVKRWWTRIQSIKSSGATFHPDTNTFQMGPEEYQNYVQAHPGDDHFINRPIKMFSQLETIYSNDSKVVNSSEVEVALGAESPDINLCTNEDKEDQDGPQPVTPITGNLDEAIVAVNDENEQQSGTSSGSRKRKRPNQTQENLSNFVGHMAVALNELSTDKTVRFAKDIMAELRTIQNEFSSRALRKAQRFLVENSLDGACFISYNKDEKVAWMKDFVDEHLGGNGN